MDISILTNDQLRELLKQIPYELKRREAQLKNDLLKDVRVLVESRGFTINQLLVKEVEEKKRIVVRVKYRHPKDSSLTWTGRGRKPKWVVAWQNSGASLESLLV